MSLLQPCLWTTTKGRGGRWTKEWTKPGGALVVANETETE